MDTSSYPIFMEALCIRDPWKLEGVMLRRKEMICEVNLKFEQTQGSHCPLCGGTLIYNDVHNKTWHHLNFFQFATDVTVSIPLFRCLCRRCRGHLYPEGIINMYFLDALLMTCPLDLKYVLGTMLADASGDVDGCFINHYKDQGIFS